MTLRVRFLQICHLGAGTQIHGITRPTEKGEVTSFGALCTALSATIGTGNIVGVATAIAAGGPGAFLWMEIAAFFGMATKYSGRPSAIKYRSIDKDGHVLGGLFYYIERGMGKNWKWLAKTFAFLGATAGLLGIGTITQVNGITSAAQNFFDPSLQHVVFSIGQGESAVPITPTTIVAGLFGHTGRGSGGHRRHQAHCRRISDHRSFYGDYIYSLCRFFCCFAICSRYPVPLSQSSLSLCTTGCPLGGVIGVTIKDAIQNGVARGIFSNEAGLGSAPIAAAAAAQTREPVRQGLVTMTGTFIDTIVVCTMTGLAIVLTEPGCLNWAKGVQITTRAFQVGLLSPPRCPRLS